jgi:hypothetical protein
MDEDALSAEVRSAVDRVFSAGTARVVFEAEMRTRAGSALVDFFAGERGERASAPERAVWSALRSAARTGERRLAEAMPGDWLGTVDFASGSFRLELQKAGRQDARYRAPGIALTRAGRGKWRRELKPDEGMTVFTPIGLLEVVRGLANASETGLEAVGGLSCRRIEGGCDVAEAHKLSRHLLDLRGHVSELHVVVWVDADGFIRRVRYRQQSGESSEAEPMLATGAQLTLGDFGSAPVPEAPDPADVDANWGKTIRQAEVVVAAWAERAGDVVPNGVVLESRSISLTMSSEGGRRGSMSLALAGLVLLVPGTAEQRLRRAFQSFATELQQFVSAHPRQRPWPGPKPETHVRVTTDNVEVWWTSPGRPSSRGQRPIEPVTVRIRPISRSELGI